MSSANALADAGVAAIAAGKYAEGIDKLSNALKQRAAPLWFLERSKAYLRTNEFDRALDDAEAALRIAYDRANRQHMMDAQLRRSITLFRMGRYADADVCAFWAIRLADGAKANEDDKQQHKVDGSGDYVVRAKEVQDEAKPRSDEGLNTVLQSAGTRTREGTLRNQALSWRIQALTHLEKLPAGHDGRSPHRALAKYPEAPAPSTTKAAPQSAPAPAAAATAATTAAGSIAGDEKSKATSSRGDWEKLWEQYHAMYTKHKIRCSFYQTETGLTVDVFLKNLLKDQVTIDSRSNTIRISPVQGASLGGFAGSIVLLLSGEIKPEATKYNVKSMKVEIILQKQRAGKWPTLRRPNAEIVDNLTMNPNQGVPFAQFFDFITTLGYSNISELELPTPGSDPSTWYTILLEKLQSKMEIGHEPFTTPRTNLTNPIPTPQPKDGTGADGSAEKIIPTSAPAYPTSSKKGAKNWDNIDDGDDEEASKEGDVNNFFQQIYKDSDEDTKRAMMKSFIESNGTALSTSWNDAKSKTYQTSPPDGVEAKKWG